jgi:hypothetical protein
MARKYAQDTSVPVGRSQENIRKLVRDRDATAFAVAEEDGRAAVSFKMAGRVLRFIISLPASDDPKEERRLWRALFMCIKAKLVIAEEGIETFDEVFLANIVMPNGQTVGQWAQPQVTQMVEGGNMPKLLSDGR